MIYFILNIIIHVKLFLKNFFVFYIKLNEYLFFYNYYFINLKNFNIVLYFIKLIFYKKILHKHLKYKKI